MRFDALVGHERTLAHWRELTSLGRLPHVMLLEGREGIGKSGLLAALAALHLCDQRTACGTCGSCRALQAGLHPEVLWLDDPEGTGRLPLESVQALQDHLSLSPAPPARFRLAVLVDADRMTNQAANSLLKLLEEPPAAGRILLSTSRPKAMLDTILSRCVKWRIAPPEARASLDWLEAKAKAEGLEAGPEQREAALKRAGLAPGLAWRFLVQGDAPADLKRLLTARRAVDVVHEAESLVRDSGLDLPALLEAVERELNASYAKGDSLGRAQARREKLRELKALATGARIPLAPTLSLEGLALSGI